MANYYYTFYCDVLKLNPVRVCVETIVQFAELHNHLVRNMTIIGNLNFFNHPVPVCACLLMFAPQLYLDTRTTMVGKWRLFAAC